MIGKTIARYEILSEIGQGGMAAVYLAHDPNFRRNVAVKLISGTFQESRVFRERFEREARLIARIEHPAIVPVYDYGEQDEQLYLVMRYMPGGSLAGKLKDGILTLGQAAKIISQIAPALDAVHAQKVVHRDLKPGNILLDGFGNPAISDFGIAHITAATSDLTGSAVIGTPSYMSPEQVRGDENLDGRSDVYALGVILFEMLTGHRPFQARTPMSVALKQLSEPLPAIRSFRPDLPVELEAVLIKAMAKDRGLRHASASELAQDLQIISATLQDEVSPPPLPVEHHRREDVSTEVDLGENSQSENHSSSLAEQDAIQPLPRAAEPVNQASAPVKRTVPPSRRMLQIAALAGLALLLFIICGSLGLFGAWARFGLPGLSPKPTQTVMPDTTSNNPTFLDTVLFADDFSDPNSGWPTIQNAQGGYGYQQDGYHINVNIIDTVLWAKTNRIDHDIKILVEAEPVTNGTNGYYGLLCRIQGDENFYYFVIQNDGNYTMGKYKNAEFVPFLNWRQSDAINTSQVNRLEAECSGSTLRFYVNDALLAEATDADFGSGFSGVIAAALDAQGFEARFNNFLILEAGQ